jgi:hypothetical protein
MRPSHLMELGCFHDLGADVIAGCCKPISESDRLGTEGSIGSNEDPDVDILIHFGQKSRC